MQKMIFKYNKYPFWKNRKELYNMTKLIILQRNKNKNRNNLKTF